MTRADRLRLVGRQLGQQRQAIAGPRAGSKRRTLIRAAANVSAVRSAASSGSASPAHEEAEQHALVAPVEGGERLRVRRGQEPLVVHASCFAEACPL